MQHGAESRETARRMTEGISCFPRPSCSGLVKRDVEQRLILVVRFSLCRRRKGGRDRNDTEQPRKQAALLHRATSSDFTSTRKVFFFSDGLKPFFIPSRAQA